MIAVHNACDPSISLLHDFLQRHPAVRMRSLLSAGVCHPALAAALPHSRSVPAHRYCLSGRQHLPDRTELA